MISGIVIINKEKGCTSNDVVRKTKKIFNTKVGHTGTLDPNATGVLPLLLGDATKISKYLINHNKEYEAVIQLGEKRTTADVEGEIIEKKIVDSNMLEKDKIEKALKSFVGKNEQIPPIYSAIKVDGKKLYEYARAGKQVEIRPRHIEIYDIELVSINKEEKQITFKVKCSKGTYIRTLCEDISAKLDSVGYMKELNRIEVGEFNIKDAITISDLEEKIKNNDFSSVLQIEDIFKDCERMELKEKDYLKYLNGISLKANENLKDGVCKVYVNGQFTGLGIIKNGMIKRDLVLTK
jgi:tRNA pseudouridine55 synthase